MTSKEDRAKRILDTPLKSRVMLPNFGSKLFELVDKPVNDEYIIKFIAYTFEAFYDTTNRKLWDAELEPKQLLFTEVNESNLEATIILTTGEELSYGN